MHKGHGPAADIDKLCELQEQIRAVQKRMGVPVHQRSYLSDVKYWLVDNESAALQHTTHTIVYECT
jgi:hypothetical protein